MNKTIDDYINNGWKLCAQLDYSANECGKDVRHVLIYSKGSLMLFYDIGAQQIIYEEKPKTFKEGFDI